MLHAATASDVELRHLLQADEEVRAFDEATQAWHETSPQPGTATLRLHQANFTLWHLEDRARDPHADNATIAEVKRAIDRTNQQRNDTVEQLDDALMRALSAAGLPEPTAPLHSETPGMMLDRLSILSLKRFHTREQTERADASAEHRERSCQRLHTLEAQSQALTGCLHSLWQEVCEGTRRFELYRQMKMYNDPAFNPVLYGAGNRASAGDS